MRTRFVMAIALMAVCIVACTSKPQQSDGNEAQGPATLKVADSLGYVVKVGDMAPDFGLTLADGGRFALGEQRGKVVMLQFTASWCGVCRKEMPHIESEIWQRHKDNANFVLVGIDREEPLATVLKFKEETGITYPVALDSVASAFCKYADKEAGITRNVLIDRDGRIAKLTRLYKEDEFAALVNEIDAMLNQ